MFGYIRFFLAYLVLLSHLNITFYGKNLGVFAVIVFYILAGLVTSKIFLKISPNNIRYFITDRILRIYPMYLSVFFTTILFFALTNYLNFKFDIYKIFLNSLLIPQNYFYFIDISLFDAPIGLNFPIPPSWSLGAELQAYIFLILSIRFKNFGIFLAFLTYFIFLLANFGLINADIYGYRLVCGVFFIFYTGYLIYIKNYKLIIFFYLPLLLLFIYFYFSSTFQIFTFETFLGYLIGVFIVTTHEHFKPRLKFNSTFGAMSYIVFLNHFPSIWFSSYFFDSNSIIIITTISFIWAYLFYLLIDIRLNSYRLNRSTRF